MPRRKRASKLRSDSEVVEMFLHNGGWGATLLTGQPTFDDEEEAAAAWELCRAATWNHPYRDRRSPPPRAAVLHDGITREAIDLITKAPVEQVRDAATADASSVEAFRRARPGAARAIAEHLDAYLNAIATAASIAELSDPTARDAALGRFQTVAGP